jgi:hypothetical protein
MYSEALGLNWWWLYLFWHYTRRLERTVYVQMSIWRVLGEVIMFFWRWIDHPACTGLGMGISASLIGILDIRAIGFPFSLISVIIILHVYD